MHALVIMLCVAAGIGPVVAGPLAPDRLRLEYMKEPRGVDVPYPARFSWALVHTDRGQTQTAYQIVVKESGGGGVFWDSSKTTSNVSQNVPLGGNTKLKADASYTWTVKCAQISKSNGAR